MSGSAISRFLIVTIFTGLPALCGDWNPRLAAQYLDSRQMQWFAWKPAAAPGGTCFSCHTGMTYLLARPALRRELGETQPTEYEKRLLDGLSARVDKRDPKDISLSFRKEPRATQALGVESIFAALFLAQEDRGNAKLSPRAEEAFDRLWALQLHDGKASGAFPWFQLELDPWEMPDSTFYGAALAAIATGSAPAAYRERPAIREHVDALVSYLRREQLSQPLHNRIMLLWASAVLPGVLPERERKAVLKELLDKQENDGGWSIASLGPWKEHPEAPESSGSNSYATGFAAFVLLEAGVSRSNPAMARALDWLRAHQDSRLGYWDATSMNKRYEPGSMPEQWMRDAATAFAALALSQPSSSTRVQPAPTSHQTLGQ